MLPEKHFDIFTIRFFISTDFFVLTENPQPSIETSVTDTTQESSDAEAITDELDQSELQDQDDTAQSSDATQVSDAEQVSSTSASLDAIPAYEGYAFVEINNNQPDKNSVSTVRFICLYFISLTAVWSAATSW